MNCCDSWRAARPLRGAACPRPRHPTRPRARSKRRRGGDAGDLNQALRQNGSRKWPTTPDVTAKPAIINIHMMVAAAARRRSSTRFAISTKSDVPAAATPIPTSV